MDPLTILQKQFGFSAFRHHQEAIINAVLQNRDVFALMPTGGGKSLCYQLPALLREGLTLVVSPLIALMKNQVDLLQQRGIDAAYINSSQTVREQENVLRKARSGELKLLYLAPERLVGNGMSLLRELTPGSIALIAIDEAHCISHWGHDFRPEYRMLADVKQVFPNTPVIALTATADKLTQRDIIEKLTLNDPAIFASSFNRPNIHYSVAPRTSDVFDDLLAFLNRHRNESGIIYCLSRKSTEELAADLSSSGITALPYHAGMDRDTRARHQERFLQNEVKIIVATIAFGMGIDKPDVRFVVHMDLPKNIESYYQETGRAGRDGAASKALLFYSASDVGKLKRFVWIENNAEQTEIQLKKLDQMGHYGELTTCRRKFLLNYFDEAAPDYCGNCDRCLESATHFDATPLAHKLLSVVDMLGNSFGVHYVVNVLRGKKEKLRRVHREHNMFGSGAEISSQAWSRLVFELTELGYLKRSRSEYRNLQLTDKGRSVLNGSANVLLESDKEVSAEWSELQGKSLPYEKALLDELISVRASLSAERKSNVPPVRALQEMATFLPQNQRDLALLPGFGKERTEHHGDVFLSIVRRYSATHRLASRMAMLPSAKPERLRFDREQRLLQQSLTLFRLGYDIEEVARLRKISREAVEKHLAYFHAKGIEAK